MITGEMIVWIMKRSCEDLEKYAKSVMKHRWEKRERLIGYRFNTHVGSVQTVVEETLQGKISEEDKDWIIQKKTCSGCGMLKLLQRRRSVSYTHLDVYKRQTLYCALHYTLNTTSVWKALFSSTFRIVSSVKQSDSLDIGHTEASERHDWEQIVLFSKMP